MGLFYTSDAEKKAEKIEKLLEGDLGKAYDSYDEKALVFLEKWQGKKLPIDSAWRDDVKARNIKERSDALNLIKEMKKADLALLNDKNIEPLVDLSIKSKTAFYKLVDERGDVDPILIVNIRAGVARKLLGNLGSTKEERENNIWFVKDQAQKAAKGYARLGLVDESAAILQDLVNKANYEYKYILEPVKALMDDHSQKIDEKDTAWMTNLVIAALKVPMRKGGNNYGRKPKDKAELLRRIQDDSIRSSVIDGLVASAQQNDAELAATLAEYTRPMYPKLTTLPNSQQKALVALVDPKKFDIMGEDAASRLNVPNLQDQFEYRNPVTGFHQNVLNGIQNSDAHVLDVIMPDLDTLDIFIGSYNRFAVAQEPKLQPLSHHTLIPEKGLSSNHDGARNKLMDIVFDAKVKDKYQAGQPQDQEMQETVTLLGNLAGDVLIGGDFTGSTEKSAAGRFVKKMILTENAHKLLGDKLEMMKSNLNNETMEIELPQFEGEGAAILNGLSVSDFRNRKEMAETLKRELAIEIKTLRQQNGQTGKITSRYETPKPE